MTKEEAKTRLKEWFPQGSTVYTILRHRAKSGMSRRISLVSLSADDGKVITRFPDYAASVALGYSYNPEKQGLVVRGCGMDMGFSVAYDLACELYGDGKALRHEWL